MTTETELKILNAAQAGNYAEVNRLTKILTPADVSTFSPVNMERIMYELARDIADGLSSYDVTAPTNSLRTFAAKLSSVLTVSAVEVPLYLLASSINVQNSSDYRAIDAITDNMNAALRQALPASVKEHIINNIAQNVTDGFLNASQTLVDQSTAALRDFMSKFGVYMSAENVDDALMQLSVDLGFWGNGDYRAIDAITDYMTSASRTALPDSVKTTVVENFGWTITGSMWSSNTTIADQATAALRDFMAKFSASIKAVSVEQTLVNLSMTGNYADSSDYRAIDAITDYMSTAAKTGLSDYAKSEIVYNIAQNVADGTVWGNDMLHDQSVLALSDFITKFTSNISAPTLAMAMNMLIYANEPLGVAAILDNVSTTVVTEIKSTFASQFAAQNMILLGNNSETITSGEGNSTIFALGGNDTVRAGGGNDVVLGGKGNDILYGDAGNDLLSGGAGTDYLYGGKGFDTFLFDSLRTGDHIMDFSVAEGDRLDLSTLLDQFDPLTEAITDFVQSATANGVTTLNVDLDGKGTASAFTAVATLDNAVQLDIAALYNNGQIIT